LKFGGDALSSGTGGVEAVYADENVWLSQKMMPQLYDVEVPTKHYNLSAIIAVGYKVNSERAVQFRKWATRVVEEFTIKGFAMDDERLKRGGSILSDRYFEEQLQRETKRLGQGAAKRPPRKRKKKLDL
jgi:hypothetical protein